MTGEVTQKPAPNPGPSLPYVSVLVVVVTAAWFGGRIFGTKIASDDGSDVWLRPDLLSDLISYAVAIATGVVAAELLGRLSRFNIASRERRASGIAVGLGFMALALLRLTLAAGESVGGETGVFLAGLAFFVCLSAMICLYIRRLRGREDAARAGT